MIKTIYYIIKCSRDVDCVQYTIYRIHEIYRIDMNISGSHAMHLQMAAATPWYNVPLVQCTMVQCTIGTITMYNGTFMVLSLGPVCQDIWIICESRQ